MAEAKNVGFVVLLGEHLPRSVVTDAKRLQQILKNLLSNAFKFTHRGQVTLTIDHADGAAAARGCQAEDSAGGDDGLRQRPALGIAA